MHTTNSSQKPNDVIIQDETNETLIKKRKLNENLPQQSEEVKQNVVSNSQNNGNNKTKTNSRKDCPYLGTIRRHLLDFDFEKLCSISLTNINVYACLVCGKYYQGRGKNTHAYFHSLEQNHHVFVNLHNQHVYCLPENYEVDDASLNDIKVIKINI